MLWTAFLKYSTQDFLTRMAALYRIYGHKFGIAPRGTKITVANEKNPAIKPETRIGIDRGDGRDDLGRLVPGKSGNLSGRPKKNLLTEAFEEMLEEKLNDPEERRRFIQAHWEKLLSKTVVSSMTLEKILDRTEGKVSQPVQVSGELSVSLSDEIRKARQRAEEGSE